MLKITYTQNADAALREGVVTLTATGGSGTAESVALTITQLGTGPNVVVRAPVGEDFLSLPAAGGTITATVALTGGATDWTAVASTSNPADFLTVGTKDLTNGMHPIAYAENTGVARTGTVTFTTVGGTGGPTARTIDFRQEGALPTITVSTDVPDITMIPAVPTGGGATGTITATITLGGGAEGWTATKSDDDSDAFISSFLPASGDATELSLAITYSTNTGVKRTATITLTTVGGTGSPATTDLVITQLAAAVVGPSVTGVTATNTVGSSSAVNFDPTSEKLAGSFYG